jgi:hypothetical protein
VTSNLKMPFIVSAIVNELGGTRVDYRVQVTSQYPPDITGTKVRHKLFCFFFLFFF